MCVWSWLPLWKAFLNGRGASLFFIGKLISAVRLSNSMHGAIILRITGQAFVLYRYHILVPYRINIKKMAHLPAKKRCFVRVQSLLNTGIVCHIYRNETLIEEYLLDCERPEVGCSYAVIFVSPVFMHITCICWSICSTGNGNRVGETNPKPPKVIFWCS